MPAAEGEAVDSPTLMPSGASSTIAVGIPVGALQSPYTCDVASSYDLLSDVASLEALSRGVDDLVAAAVASEAGDTRRGNPSAFELDYVPGDSHRCRGAYERILRDSLPAVVLYSTFRAFGKGRSFYTRVGRRVVRRPVRPRGGTGGYTYRIRFLSYSTLFVIRLKLPNSRPVRARTPRLPCPCPLSAS